MSKAKHTPGPWKAFIVGKVVEVQAQKGKPPIVGWTGFDESDVPLVTHRANARLIAAAPDLLALLEKLWDETETGVSSHGRWYMTNFTPETAQKIKVAIAAAKGEL